MLFQLYVHSLFGAGREAFDLNQSFFKLLPKFLLKPPDLDSIELSFLAVLLDVLTLRKDEELAIEGPFFPPLHFYLVLFA